MRHSKNYAKKSGFDTYVIYIIAILSLLPFSNRMVILRGLILLLIFLVNNFIIKSSMHIELVKFDKIIFIFIFFLISSYLLAIAVGVFYANGIDLQKIFHEGTRLVYYVLTILVISKLCVKFDTILQTMKVLLVFHLAIQLLQWFGSSEINIFIENIYVSNRIVTTTTRHLNLADKTLGTSFRSGSIFLNPNVYMVYPLIFLLFFLEARLAKKKSIYNVWIFFTFVSLFLTGSRSSLIISIVIVLLYINNFKVVISLLTFFLLILSILSFYDIFSISINSRWFQVQEGLFDSLAVKFNGFIYYLKNVDSIWLFLFGSLATKFSSIQIDMEIGYILLWFGILGYFWYGIILKLILRMNYSKRIKMGVLSIFLLVGVTATIYFNITVFPFFSLLIFLKIDNYADKSDTAKRDENEVFFLLRR
jgi:hypothetical protein